MIERILVALLVAVLSIAGGSVKYKESSGLTGQFWVLNEVIAGDLPNVIFADNFEDPAIILESPPDGATTCIPELILTGHVSANVVQLLIDSVATPLDGLQFTSAILMLEDGPNVIELEAVLTGGGSYFLQAIFHLIPPLKPVNTDLVDVTTLSHL